MKKSAWLLRSLAVPLAVALVTIGLGTVAHAAKKVKAREMTCQEFLELGTEVQPRVVYWLEGYSKSGKLEDAEIDVESFERPVGMIVTDCRAAPKATLWEKVKKYF